MGSFDGLSPAERDVLAARAIQQVVDVLLVTDESLTLQYVSDGVRFVLGFEPDEMVGHNGLEWLHPEDLAMFSSILSMLGDGYSPTASGLYRIRCKDGSYVVLEASGGSWLAEPDVTGGYWMLGRVPLRSEVYANVLRRVLNEEPLSRALEQITVLFPLMGEAFYICEWGSGAPMFVAGVDIPAELYGSDRTLGTPWDQAGRTGKNWSSEVSQLEEPLAQKAVEHGFAGLYIVPVKGVDGVTAALMTLWTPEGVPMPDAAVRAIGLQDLVEAAIRIRLQVEDLRRTARLDSLTGLANRLAFHDALRSADYGEQVVVLYIDLDEFKDINDAYGHGTGDRMLQVVAQRIEGSVRTADLVSRLGGDEFAVLCRRCGRQEAGELAKRILHTLRQPVVIEGISMTIKASIGIAWADAADPEMLTRADQALYSAKRAGRDTIRFSESNNDA